MPEPADWTWEFATAATAAELGTHPELLLKTATPVKANPVRKVFRTKEFYLKFDCRPGNRLAREWRSAALLAARHIPMVEHLAWGRSSQGELLITRALPDAEQAGTYFFHQCLQNGAPAEEFAEALAEFARQIIGSGLFHPDFHCGNVLYLPERNQFALVDVYGVRRATMFDHFRYYRMERILMELREAFDRARLLRLLAVEGVSAPESFYRKALHREARHLFHEWPKRRRQILAGYPKFTRAEESLLRVVDPAGEVCDVSGEWQIFSVRDAFRAFADEDADRCAEEEARFETVLVEQVEPKLPKDVPCVLIDYPIRFGAFARPKAEDPTLAERWEIYIHGVEIANAYGELTDPEEQERRFLRCNRKRVESGLPAYPEATEFLEGIRAGIPASSGCALGFDRIVMLLFGAKTLAEVSFPLDLN